MKTLNKPKAISVLSGGLDSTVATVYFKDTYDIHALTFEYGQRSARMEIQSSKLICEELNIKHTVIELPWLRNLGSSALTSEEDIPQLKMEELDDKSICNETARNVWVPARNIIFVAIASSFAEAEGAEKIIVGWDYEEATTFPDNSKEFLNAFNELLKHGTIFVKIKIEAPLINMNKSEIVSLGTRLGAPLKLSYSCYQGDSIHCGVCESCLRRRRAFEDAGIEDKTKYAI